MMVPQTAVIIFMIVTQNNLSTDYRTLSQHAESEQYAHACTVSSVSKVIELQSQGLIPNWVGDYLLLHLVQIGSGTHQASFPVGTGTLSLEAEQLVHRPDHSPVILPRSGMYSLISIPLLDLRKLCLRMGNIYLYHTCIFLIHEISWFCWLLEWHEGQNPLEVGASIGCNSVYFQWQSEVTTRRYDLQLIMDYEP